MAPPLRRNRDFVLLQVGQAFSTLGSESTAVAYPLLVLALTHSPLKAGIVGFCRLGPYAVVVLLAGLAVDRWERKPLMMVSDVVRALAMTSLVVALALGRLAYPQIVVAAVVESSMFALFNIAELGTLAQVVPKRQLPDAAAVEQTRLAGIFLAAPPLGGFLFGLGRALPFLADAISYTFSLGTLLAMRTPFQEEREERASVGWRGEIAEGFAWLWTRPFLRTTAFLFTGVNFAIEAILLTVIVAGRRQGLSPSAIGGLVAAFGGSSLVGSLVSRQLLRLLSSRTLLLTVLWLTIGSGAYLLYGSVYVLLAGSVPAFLLAPTLFALIIGYRNAVVPDRLRGRVNSVARLIALAGAPVGSLAAGALLGSFSTHTTVALLVAGLVLIALWGTLSPSTRDAPSLGELQ